MPMHDVVRSALDGVLHVVGTASQVVTNLHRMQLITALSTAMRVIHVDPRVVRSRESRGRETLGDVDVIGSPSCSGPESLVEPADTDERVASEREASSVDLAGTKGPVRLKHFLDYRFVDSVRTIRLRCR